MNEVAPTLHHCILFLLLAGFYFFFDFDFDVDFFTWEMVSVLKLALMVWYFQAA